MDIETRRAADAPVHRTTIWVVVADGEAYVRSEYGKKGRWYREPMANPDAVLHAAGEAIPVRAVRADDPESVARASAGYRAKYGDSSALALMVRDEIAPTTWSSPLSPARTHEPAAPPHATRSIPGWESRPRSKRRRMCLGDEVHRDVRVEQDHSGVFARYPRSISPSISSMSGVGKL